MKNYYVVINYFDSGNRIRRGPIEVRSASEAIEKAKETPHSSIDVMGETGSVLRTMVFSPQHPISSSTLNKLLMRDRTSGGNSPRRPRFGKKFERCVRHVKKTKGARRGKVNPWAVCHASVKKSPSKLSHKALMALAAVNYRWLTTKAEDDAAHNELIPGGYVNAEGTWYLTPKGVAALEKAFRENATLRSLKPHAKSPRGGHVNRASVKKTAKGKSVKRRDPSRPWVLKHDSTVKGHFKNPDAALAALHNLQGQSWDYALRYGGWKVENPQTGQKIKPYSSGSARSPRRKSPRGGSKAPHSPASGFGREKTATDIRARIAWEKWAADRARRAGQEALAQGHDLARVAYEQLLHKKNQQSPRGGHVNRPKHARSPYSKAAYDADEAKRFRADLAGAERNWKAASPQEKKREIEAFAHDLAQAANGRDKLVFERISWLLDGTMGYGAMQAARNQLRARGNVGAWLVQTVGVLDRRLSRAATVQAWKKLSHHEQEALARGLTHLINQARSN